MKLRANSEGATLVRRSRIPVKLFAFSLSRRAAYFRLGSAQQRAQT